MKPARSRLLRGMAAAVCAVTSLGACGVAEEAASGDTTQSEVEALAPPGLELTREWKWSPPPPAPLGMPAADGDDIAITSEQRLVMLDRAGAVRWEAQRPLRSVPPAFSADMVLAPTGDGLAAFDRRSGRVRWEAKLGERVNTPAVAAGTAVVTTWEGSLAGIDLRDGKVRWQAKLGGSALGPPAAAGTVVVATFATGGSSGAVAVEAASGRQRWKVALPAGGTSAPAVVAVPGAGEVVVMAAGDLAAHGLSLTDGSERWRTTLEGAGSPEVPPLALPGGRVLVAHRLGGMAMLDARDGTEHWTAQSDQAAVKGGPAGPGPNGWFALPLWDGAVLFAKEDHTQVKEPPGQITGVARGPGGLLLAGITNGQENGLDALLGW
jgi:outer membrane protein assembly factor BamB